MKKITQELTSAAAVILEGKAKVEEVKYPHDMFHPETGEKEVAKDEAEHKALADKGYTHEKPEVDEVAEPEAQGEKDFKAKHVIKKSGAETDGTIVKEDLDEGIMSEIDAMLQDGKTAAQIAKALKLNLKDVTKIIKTFGEGLKEAKVTETPDLCEECGKVHEGKCAPVGEASDKQKKYQAFFKKALAKFGVKSPSELEKDKRSEFFDYVDANYEADNETD
jgi:hypothetical protein